MCGQSRDGDCVKGRESCGIEWDHKKGLYLQIQSRHAGHGGRKLKRDKREGQRSEVCVRGKCEQLSKGRRMSGIDAFHGRYFELSKQGKHRRK